MPVPVRGVRVRVLVPVAVGKKGNGRKVRVWAKNRMIELQYG